MVDLGIHVARKTRDVPAPQPQSYSGAAILLLDCAEVTIVLLPFISIVAGFFAFTQRVQWGWLAMVYGIVALIAAVPAIALLECCRYVVRWLERHE